MQEILVVVTYVLAMGIASVLGWNYGRQIGITGISVPPITRVGVGSGIVLIIASTLFCVMQGDRWAIWAYITSMGWLMSVMGGQHFQDYLNEREKLLAHVSA